MYQIISENFNGYTDNIIYIKLHPENGSYVICPKEEAEGICAKLPKKIQEEEKEVITSEDVVFALEKGKLNGIEETCSFSPVQVAQDFFEAKQAMELLAMLEEVL